MTGILDTTGNGPLTVGEIVSVLNKAWEDSYNRRREALAKLPSEHELVYFAADYARLEPPVFVAGEVYTVAWEGHSLLPPYERTEHVVQRMLAEVSIDADGLEHWRFVPLVGE